MLLSKSLYIRGLQCTKSLWLKIHNSSVLTTDEDQSKFETGQKVGLLAQQLFLKGREINLSTPGEQIKETQAYINSGIKTIYEATFEFDGVMIMVDILNIDKTGFNIYEVKSSTKVKQTHMDDLSIQYYVLNGLGYQIKSSNIICLNNKYVRKETLDIKQLFQINNVSNSIIDLQEDIPGKIKKFREVLNGKEVDVSIGQHCTIPYKCHAYNYCWKHIPDNSVFTISGLCMRRKMELYANNVISLNQIKDLNSFSRNQQIQIQSELSNKPIIDRKAISKFLSGLTYPIYHLDFESYQQAIPEWSGISSYMNIPFQYSLHIEYESGCLEHREFLAVSGEDQRLELIKHLIEDIPGDVTILAYNMSFEKGIINNLALSFPQFSAHLLAINNNIKDLMPPFKKKQYYAPTMKGSYSIKAVLPALVPEMEDAYRGLDGIHNGMDAMTIFPKLVNMEEERQEYRTALLKYCKLDTLAMVKILAVLRDS